MSDTTTPPEGGDFATNPLAMGLLGLAQGFGQAAMPTPYKGGTPLGAMLGMAAGGALKGVQGAQQYSMGQQQLQAAKAANERTKLFLDQWKSGGSGGAPFGVPGSGGTGASGDSPVITYADAIRNMQMYSLDPKGGPQARAWGELARSLTPTGGGYVGTRAGGIMPVPGADPSAAGRTAAVEGTKANIDVNKAWAMLAPETQKALAAAGIDINKAFNMPQSYVPGNTVATPRQMQDPGVPPAADPFPDIARRIQGAENGGGTPDAKNPKSTATGNGQFLEDTWPSVLAATRPDLLKDRTPAQILALRADPGLASQATEMYARQNGAALARAGFDVTPENIYLAHHFGPGGAIAALKANPNLPFGMVIPNGAQVLEKNPYLQGKTVADVIKLVGGRLPGVPANPAPSAGPAPGAKPTVVPASPQATEADAEGKRMATLPVEINTAAKESQNALNRIALVQKAMAESTKGGIPAGYFSPELARAAAAAKSLGISIPGVDPKAVGNAQVANEALVQISGEILKRLFPQRITNMDIKLYGSALPHYGMDPAALDTLLDQAKQAAQYDVNRAQNMNAYKAKHNDSLQGWEPQFYQAQGYGPQFFQAMEAAQGQPSGGNAGAAPPPDALKEGQATTFRNGQVWTLQNGKQTRLR